SNSYRTRSWKAGLAELALQAGLEITVCHFPPGTSKWNKIEHRLFSCITHNWRGRPLTSHEVIVNTIAATTTRTGLRVRATLDTGLYPLEVQVSDAQMAALPLARHPWHGDWNYTLLPYPPAPPPPPAPPAPTPPHPRRATTPPPPPELPRARGGPPTRKPGGGPPPALPLAEKTLIPIIRARFRPPRHVLAGLFGVHPDTIAKAEHHIA